MSPSTYPSNFYQTTTSNVQFGSYYSCSEPFHFLLSSQQKCNLLGLESTLFQTLTFVAPLLSLYPCFLLPNTQPSKPNQIIAISPIFPSFCFYSYCYLNFIVGPAQHPLPANPVADHHRTWYNARPRLQNVFSWLSSSALSLGETHLYPSDESGAVSLSSPSSCP